MKYFICEICGQPTSFLNIVELKDKFAKKLRKNKAIVCFGCDNRVTKENLKKSG